MIPKPSKSEKDFVGSPYYVSPEMLKHSIAYRASDLWALGCILFKMLTGDVPFNGASDYDTFNLILERRITFPPKCLIDNEAVDLIDSLL